MQDIEWSDFTKVSYSVIHSSWYTAAFTFCAPRPFRQRLFDSRNEHSAVRLKQGKKDLRWKGPIVLPRLALFLFLFLSFHSFSHVCFVLHTYTYLTGTVGFSIIIPSVSDFKCVSVSITKIRLPGQGESLHSAPSEWLGHNEHLECILGFFTWLLIDPIPSHSSRTIKTC